MTTDEAIPIAMDAVKKLFHGTDHRLEELEVRDDGEVAVTVSYHAPGRDALTYGTLAGRRAAIGVDPTRTYKDVRVGTDGQVKSIRMRQIFVG